MAKSTKKPSPTSTKAPTSAPKFPYATTPNALRKFLDNEQIVELTLNTAFYNMVVRFLVPMQVDLEPGAREH